MCLLNGSPVMLYDSMIPVIAAIKLRTPPGDACNALKRAFMEEKRSSMGLSCGVYGGRNLHERPPDDVAGRTSAVLWILQLLGC